MGVTGSCVVQLFGTTPCDFGTIAWWWLACSVFGLASRCLLPSLARGFPSRVYSFACCPVASTPARLPPAPPFRGERAGGSWAGEIGMCPDARSGIWLEVIDVAEWLQHQGCCRDLPSHISCSSPLWE